MLRYFKANPKGSYKACVAWRARVSYCRESRTVVGRTRPYSNIPDWLLKAAPISSCHLYGKWNGLAPTSRIHGPTARQAPQQNKIQLPAWSNRPELEIQTALTEIKLSERLRGNYIYVRRSNKRASHGIEKVTIFLNMWTWQFWHPIAIDQNGTQRTKCRSFLNSWSWRTRTQVGERQKVRKTGGPNCHPHLVDSSTRYS